MVTSVASAASVVPDEFVLEQNYPNPFNPTTMIAFGLPEDSEVKITIFNLLGEVVRTLTNSNFSAGYHTLTWDAKDDNGQQLSGGMYIYRLQAESMVQSRKMILLK
jgi:flagellar hook assembly protein FlgD